LEGLGPDEQVAEWERVALDPRPRAASGFDPLDDLLNRRSFGPEELVILGGRMHTRKTAVMVNVIANLLRAGVPTGLVGLDEGPAKYVAKLASVLCGVPHTTLMEPEHWNSKRMKQVRDEYKELAKLFSLTCRYRPTFDQLTGWLETADVTAARPRVVFIDYLSLLAFERYSKGNTERVQRLAENLQVWTNEQGLTVVALHQVGRADDTSKRYHGDSPMTPEQLMYGGEQAADIILSTFRPELEPIGNMTERQALAEGIDGEEWEAKRTLVEQFEGITMLQLTKNRPGVRLLYRGFPLKSHGESQRMVPIEDQLDEGMALVTDEGAADE
jgi:replicative DNA helicase